MTFIIKLYIIPHVIQQQDYALFMYQNNAKNMKMDWETDKKQYRKNSGILASSNIFQHQLGPTRT